MVLASLLVPGLVTGCGGDDSGGTDPASFESQPWVLVSGIDLPADVAVSAPSATFDAGTVAGSTGCNRYTAAYTVDGDSLEIGQIASTRIACPPPADAIETAYVEALGQVSAWRTEDDELVLVGADDDELLRYQGATPVGDWQVTGLLRGDASTSPLAGTELTARFDEAGALSGICGMQQVHRLVYERQGHDRDHVSGRDAQDLRRPGWSHGAGDGLPRLAADGSELPRRRDAAGAPERGRDAARHVRPRRRLIHA